MARRLLVDMTLREWVRWRWTQITINWFTLGLTCAVKDHQPREQSVGCRYCTHTVCARCGKFKGCRGRDTPIPNVRPLRKERP